MVVHESIFIVNVHPESKKIMNPDSVLGEVFRAVHSQFEHLFSEIEPIKEAVKDFLPSEVEHDKEYSVFYKEYEFRFKILDEETLMNS